MVCLYGLETKKLIVAHLSMESLDYVMLNAYFDKACILSKEYFGELGMLGYVLHVQREEIRNGIACVKHQIMSGSNIGDDHKEYFAGDAALKAGGKDNTMNQFG